MSVSTKGSTMSPTRDLENPYKAAGSHLIDAEFVKNEEARIAKEVEEACKNNPEIKKEIEKANEEQDKLM